MAIPLSPTLEYAVKMDQIDPLSKYRHEFILPQGIYLVGNSLGPLSIESKANIDEELAKWSSIGVKGHFTGKRPWLYCEDKCEALLVDILGASSVKEVCVMNGLTVNCHLMFVSFYRPTQRRYKVLIEGQAFGSDHHMVQSQIAFHGIVQNPLDAVIEINPRPGEDCIRTEDILRLIEENSDSLALIWIGAVQFLTGQYFDLQRITQKAHEYPDILVGFNLAHATGNVPLKLHDWEVDFATFCSYKYLCSGAGGIGGAWIHSKHHSESKNMQIFKGWFGQTPQDRLKMSSKVHRLNETAQGWKISNTPALLAASFEGSLNVYAKAGGMVPFRQKSVLMTGYLETLLDSLIGKEFIRIATPSNPDERGCQLTLVFVKNGLNGKKLEEELLNRGAFCDCRDDSVRVAPHPLYNSFREVWEFVQILKDCIQMQLGRRQSPRRSKL